MNHLVHDLFLRLDSTRSEHPDNLTNEVLTVGEALLKLTVLGLLAAVQSDPERSGYALEYRLTKAGGLGTWSNLPNDLTNGPAAQHLVADITEDILLLDEKHGAGHYLHEVGAITRRVLSQVQPEVRPNLRSARGITWIHDFVAIRNATRGHGALPSRLYVTLGAELEPALRLFAKHYPLFQRGWAHVRRNESTKYRVNMLSDYDKDRFEHLKRRSETPINLADGIYIAMGEELRRVPLAFPDEDTAGGFKGLYLPNGQAKDARLPVLDYGSGRRQTQSLPDHSKRPGKLPPSETSARSELYIPEGAGAFANQECP